MTNVYCISTAQAGMFAGLCLLGVRSRPARNLLLSSSQLSRAPLLGSSGGPGGEAAAEAEAGPGDSRRLSLVPGPASRAPAGQLRHGSCSWPAAAPWSCPALAPTNPG